MGSSAPSWETTPHSWCDSYLASAREALTRWRGPREAGRFRRFTPPSCGREKNRTRLPRRRRRLIAHRIGGVKELPERRADVLARIGRREDETHRRHRGVYLT